MQERIRHEHQTPMFPNGFSVPHAVLVQAQMRFPVLIKGFYGPALQIQSDDPFRAPVHPIGHQHRTGAAQLRAVETQDQPDFAEPRETHGQCKRPVGGVPHGHRPVRGGRNERDEVFHRNMWPVQPDGMPCRILHDKAVSLQIPVLLQQADPVFFVVAGHRHQFISEIPTVEQQDAKRDFMSYGGFQEFNAQIDLGTKLLVQVLKVGGVHQDRVHGLVEPCSVFLRGRDRAVGKVFVDKGFPVGEFFIAPIQAEVQWKAYGAADIMTRDWIVGERVCVIAMIVMTVNIVEQIPYMLAQGIIQNQDRIRFRSTDRLRLLEQIRDATVIDAVLEPRRCREEAGEVGFVRTLEHTAGDVRQTFVVQDDQASQVMLKMAKLAPILKEIAKDVRVGSHDGSRSYDGKLHKTFALSPKGRGRASEYHIDVRNGKTQQASHFSRRLHRLKETFILLFNLLGDVWKKLNYEAIYVIDSLPIAVCDNIRIKRNKLYPEEKFRGYLPSILYRTLC